jgi:hypothetical protein
MTSIFSDRLAFIVVGKQTDSNWRRKVSEEKQQMSSLGDPWLCR